MVRIVLAFALSAASAGAANLKDADKAVFAVHTFKSTTAKCDDPTTAPAESNYGVGLCVVAGTKSYKLPDKCPDAPGTITVKQFADINCPTDKPDTPAEVKPDTKGTCTTVAGIDLTITSCMIKSCTGEVTTDKDGKPVGLTCTAKDAKTDTKKANNTTNGTSDNAMTAGIAGAFLLSASALIIA